MSEMLLSSFETATVSLSSSSAVGAIYFIFIIVARFMRRVLPVGPKEGSGRGSIIRKEAAAAMS